MESSHVSSEFQDNCQDIDQVTSVLGFLEHPQSLDVGSDKTCPVRSNYVTTDHITAPKRIAQNR